MHILVLSYHWNYHIHSIKRTFPIKHMNIFAKLVISEANLNVGSSVLNM